MKTYKVLLCISAVLLAGCTVEQPEPTVAIGQKEITITAYRSDEPETKTQRDESNGAVLWTPGDAISLFYGSGTEGGSKFTSNASEPTAITNFTGTIGVITGGADVSVEDTYFWGLYPYDPEAECDGSSVVTTLPNRQKAVPGTFDTGVFPSLGRAQGLSMGFYNICGGLRITVTRDDIKSVTLKAIGGEKIAGKARIGFDGGVPKDLEIMDGSDEITITAPAGKFLEPGKFYYFVAFPQTLSQGVQLTMESFSEMGVFERRPSANGMSVKRSVFGNLRNIDQGIEFTKKTGPIPIEDPVFKTYLVQHHDADGDGEISYEEAESVREVVLYPSNEYNLQSLAGIEYMPNLERIDCHGEWYDTGDKSTPIQREHYYVGPYEDCVDIWGPIGTLRYVDVSNNPKLRELCIQDNSALGVEMGTLDVSRCPNLVTINIGMTWLEYPDVSTNTELDFIQFHHLRGTLPDFSRLTKVKYLFIEWPQDKQVDYVDLDVSHMKDLEVLYVANRIRSLSVLSANPKLRELYCWDNPASSDNLDMSGCPELEKLTLNNAGLRSLVLSNNSKLKELYCNWNQLTELDLSGNPQLEWLECVDNPISNLTLPNSLKEIKCWNTHIGSIDVSSMENLQLLECANSGLTSLDVSNNPKLWKLSINDNQIGSIDLSQNPLLQELAIWNCGLTTLDLSNNPELTWLRCWGNRIRILDVSHNTKLGTRSTYDDHDNGLSCAPMNDEQGNNVLSTLFITPNQTIPYVTENRSSNHIPAQTVIRTVTGGIPIEDPGFRSYLLAQGWDKNNDGQISYTEAQEITSISMNSEDWNIWSLQGIEYMTNLDYLWCAGGWNDGPLGTLRKVDVSNNLKLRVLNLGHNGELGNAIGGIDLSRHRELREIYFWYNYLAHPQISHLRNTLVVYETRGAKGEVPDFSGFTHLRKLEILFPDDTEYIIDVSSSPDLEKLILTDPAWDNPGAFQISDLSLNTKLNNLELDGSPMVRSLTSMLGIALPLMADLEKVRLVDLGLQSLDLSNNTKLLSIDCSVNSINALTLPGNNVIEYLNVNWNQLTSLILTGLPSLRELYCDGNPMTELDVNHNTDLRRLGFSSTQITDIDVSNNKELTLIGCDNIPGLTHLDLRQNTKLDGLCIRNDGFNSIDISHNVLLQSLLCEGNTISALNVSNNRLLRELSCVQQNRPDGKNYLQTLYVSEGQSIPHITIDRNADYIPAETIITTAPQSGGGEGTGEEDW